MNSYENPSLSYECDLTAERDRLREINKELLAALEALTATARTFRNVPKNEQEWTPIDDEALNAAFAAIAKARGQQGDPSEPGHPDNPRSEYSA